MPTCYKFRCPECGANWENYVGGGGIGVATKHGTSFIGDNGLTKEVDMGEQLCVNCQTKKMMKQQENNQQGFSENANQDFEQEFSTPFGQMASNIAENFGATEQISDIAGSVGDLAGGMIGMIGQFSAMKKQKEQQKREAAERRRQEELRKQREAQERLQQLRQNKIMSYFKGNMSVDLEDFVKSMQFQNKTDAMHYLFENNFNGIKIRGNKLCFGKAAHWNEPQSNLPKVNRRFSDNDYDPTKEIKNDFSNELWQRARQNLPSKKWSSPNKESDEYNPFTDKKLAAEIQKQKKAFLDTKKEKIQKKLQKAKNQVKTQKLMNDPDIKVALKECGLKASDFDPLVKDMTEAFVDELVGMQKDEILDALMKKGLLPKFKNMKQTYFDNPLNQVLGVKAKVEKYVDIFSKVPDKIISGLKEELGLTPNDQNMYENYQPINRDKSHWATTDEFGKPLKND